MTARIPEGDGRPPQVMDNWQDKRQCFAGARLGGGHQVATRQCRRDGLGLYGCWLGKAVLGQIAL